MSHVVYGLGFGVLRLGSLGLRIAKIMVIVSLWNSGLWMQGPKEKLTRFRV